MIAVRKLYVACYVEGATLGRHDAALMQRLQDAKKIIHAAAGWDFARAFAMQCMPHFGVEFAAFDAGASCNACAAESTIMRTRAPSVLVAQPSEIDLLFRRWRTFAADNATTLSWHGNVWQLVPEKLADNRPAYKATLLRGPL